MKTICDMCNKIIERQPSWLRGKKHFCNKQCHIKFQATLSGDKTNNWRGGPYKFKCKVCNKDCEKKRNSVKPKYCSLACAHKDNATASKGEKHWNWKARYDSRYLRKLAPRPKPECCEICNAPDRIFKKGLCLDHNHQTRQFRGWLCTNCNTILGLSKENTQTLELIIQYIQKHQ